MDLTEIKNELIDKMDASQYDDCIYNYFVSGSFRSMSYPPSEIEQASMISCLCAQTRRVDRLLNRIYDDSLRPLGINTMQKSLLTNIGRFPEGIDSAALSERHAFDRSTLTRNLTTLEQRGFVTVTTNPLDRRKRNVTLTDAGRATVAASEPLWRDAQQQVVEALGYDRAVDMSTMLADVERIVRGLDS